MHFYEVTRMLAEITNQVGITRHVLKSKVKILLCTMGLRNPICILVFKINEKQAEREFSNI